MILLPEHTDGPYYPVQAPDVGVPVVEVIEVGPRQVVVKAEVKLGLDEDGEESLWTTIEASPIKLGMLIVALNQLHDYVHDMMNHAKRAAARVGPDAPAGSESSVETQSAVRKITEN